MASVYGKIFPLTSRCLLVVSCSVCVCVCVCVCACVRAVRAACVGENAASMFDHTPVYTSWCCMVVCVCVWQVARMHDCRQTHNGSTCYLCKMSSIDLLALCLSLQRQGTWGPFLIVSPASTLHNWQQECTRFVPHFKVSRAREKVGRSPFD